MANRIYLNGRFLSSPRTGVQRVGEQLIRAMDRVIALNPGRYGKGFELLEPARAKRGLVLDHIRSTRFGGLPSILWEQITLPWRSRGGLGLNLCNVGPVAKRQSVTMVHDAQVYTTPQSYSAPFRLWYRFLQPLLGKRHRLILTVSEYSKAQLASCGVAPASKIKVIYNGVDHVLDFGRDDAIVAGAGLRPGRYALGLASLQPHKNTAVLLRTWGQQACGDIRLALFGHVDRAAFEAAFGPLPDNIVLLGRISDAQLRSLLEQALCYVCPSTTEGFGLPVLEAMMLGCPAIAAPCGALPEVCGDAVLYADPHDADAWGKAVMRLVQDPQKRAALVEAGRTQARPFSWANAAGALLDTLSALNDAPLNEKAPVRRKGSLQ
jgi:glycosyltransferase involved in cell wall biosynthesis